MISKKHIYDDIMMHGRRVRKIAEEIAINLNLKESEIDNLSIASQMHDIGKLDIPYAILYKEGELTHEEFELIREHVKYSFEYLSRKNYHDSALAALCHHEHMDGTGYLKLKDRFIPYLSRILTLSDVFDALLTDRPYRRAYTYDETLKIIDDHKLKYDPDVYRVFKQISYDLYNDIYIKNKDFYIWSIWRYDNEN